MLYDYVPTNPVGSKSFLEYRDKNMKKTRHDGIYKKTTRPGNKPIGKLDDMKINYSYEVYQEGHEFPLFPQKNSVLSVAEGKENVPGINAALETMKISEDSIFFIPSKLLYKTGDMILRIKVISADKCEVKNPVTKAATRFQQTFDKVLESDGKALQLMQSKDFDGAASLFKRMIAILEENRSANETEDEKNKKLLMKAYFSSAKCYLELGKFGKVCIMLKELKIHDSAYHKNSEALYMEGVAMLEFEHFIKADGLLRKACSLRPRNREFRDALNRLRNSRSEAMKREAKRLIAIEEEERKTKQDDQEKQTLIEREQEEKRLAFLEADGKQRILEDKVLTFISNIGTEMSEFETHEVDFEIQNAKEMEMISKVFEKNGFNLHSTELLNLQRVFYVQKSKNEP